LYLSNPIEITSVIPVSYSLIVNGVRQWDGFIIEALPLVSQKAEDGQKNVAIYNNVTM
jgi:hypothetical protein